MIKINHTFLSVCFKQYVKLSRSCIDFHAIAETRKDAPQKVFFVLSIKKISFFFFTFDNENVSVVAACDVHRTANWTVLAGVQSLGIYVRRVSLWYDEGHG